jgi:hypothetical protein
MKVSVRLRGCAQYSKIWFWRREILGAGSGEAVNEARVFLRILASFAFSHVKVYVGKIAGVVGL